MAKLSSDDLLDAFKEMTLLELSEFVKQFETTFDVTAAAPVAVAAAPAAGGGGGAGRGRRGAERVRRHPRSRGREEDPGHQGGAHAHQPRPQGGQGSGRRRARRPSWRRSTRRRPTRPRPPSRAPAPRSPSSSSRAVVRAARYRSWPAMARQHPTATPPKLPFRRRSAQSVAEFRPQLCLTRRTREARCSATARRPDARCQRSRIQRTCRDDGGTAT